MSRIVSTQGLPSECKGADLYGEGLAFDPADLTLEERIQRSEWEYRREQRQRQQTGNQRKGVNLLAQ